MISLFLPYVAPYNEEEEEEEEEELTDPQNHYHTGQYSFVFPEGYETMTMEWIDAQEYFLMNWGWNGEGDDVYCLTAVNEWLSPLSPYAYQVSSAVVITGFAPAEIE